MLNKNMRNMWQSRRTITMPGDGVRTTVRLEEMGVVRLGRDGREMENSERYFLSARSAEITTIVGPSGGGKSTLIRLINRLSDPTRGTVYLDEGG